MKKSLFILISLFVMVLPIKIFGLTGTLYDNSTLNYTVKVTNPNGAKVYAAGKWCPDCGYYYAFDLAPEQELKVLGEFYDYNKYIATNENLNNKIFIHIDPSAINNETKKALNYQKLIDEGKEYEEDEFNESEVFSKLTYVVLYDDVTITNELSYDQNLIIPFDDNCEDEFCKDSLVNPKSTINLVVFKDPSIFSEQVTVLEEEIDSTSFDTQYESWIHVNTPTVSGWINRNITKNDIKLEKPTETVDDPEVTEETNKSVTLGNKEMTIIMAIAIVVMFFIIVLLVAKLSKRKDTVV